MQCWGRRRRPKSGGQNFLASGGGGTHTDHKESRVGDLLEEEARRELEDNDEFKALAPEAQKNMARFYRAFCFQHKIDNVAKAITTGINNVAKQIGALQSGDERGQTYSDTVTNFLHSLMKCVAQPNSQNTSNNIVLHADFMVFLKRNGHTDALEVMKSLGSQIGDRFWKLTKSAGRAFFLLPFVIDFLTVHLAAKKLLDNKPPNALEISVASLCVDPRIQSELLCLVLWEHALFQPALMMSANKMKNYADVFTVVRQIDALLHLVASSTEEAERMMKPTGDLSPPSSIFQDSETFFSVVEHSLVDDLVYIEMYRRMAELSTDERLYVRDLLMVTASEGEKKQKLMSKDMLGAESPVQALFAKGTLVDSILLKGAEGILHGNAMAPDNIKACERVFGMFDFFLGKSSTYNIQRLDALLQYKINETDQRMQELRDSTDPAQRAMHRIIAAFTTKDSNVEAYRARGKQTVDRIDREKQEKQAARAQQAEDKAAAKEALSTAHKKGSIWDLSEIDTKIEGIVGAQARTKAICEQLDFYKVCQRA